MTNELIKKTLSESLGSIREFHKAEGRILINDFISVNNLYIIGQGKNKAWITLNPKAKAIKQDIKLKIKGIDNNILDNCVCYKAKFQFIAGEDYWVNNKGSLKRIDLSNFIKLYEDAITESLGIDDSKCRKIETEKITSDDINKYVEYEIIFERYE